MRINYDFSDLEAFLAVKETGSFHLAAARLNLSQSAITRRVQKLETALDSKLFERTTRAVRPTLAAKRLHARAEAILDGARETTRAMRDESVAFGHQRSSIVTIGILPTIAATLLPLALRSFRAKGHNARVRVLDGNANEVAEAVASGEADFGVSSIPMLEPATSFETLFDDHIVLVMPTGHRLSQQATLTWTDLAGEDLIVPMRGTGNRMLIDEAMAQSAHPIGWTFEVGRSATALELVATRVGVALLPQSALASGGFQTVTARPMTRPTITRPIGLLTRSGQSETRLVTELKLAICAAAPVGGMTPTK